MITVYTETPEEVISSLKSYFFIDNRYAILTFPNEIDELMDTWIEVFDGIKLNPTNKFIFNSPFLVVTSSHDVIDTIDANFIYILMNEITDILEVGPLFIKQGFLPLDQTVIKSYISKTTNPSDSDEDKILSVFKDLKYINQDNSPTEKLALTLYDNEETRKYSEIIMILLSNSYLMLDDPKFKGFILEVLKFIDINVYAAVYGVNDEADDTIHIYNVSEIKNKSMEEEQKPTEN